MTASPIKELAAETALLTDHIGKMKKGQIASYAELSELVGVDVQREGYHYLAAARDRAQRRLGVVTSAITNKGIERLTAEGIAHESEPARARISRMVRRFARRTAQVTKEEYDQLPAAARLELDHGRTVFGAVRLITSPRQHTKIAAAVSQTQAPIPSRKFLALFAPKPRVSK